MEVDLYALRQLYRLLQTIIGGVSNVTLQHVCDSLDKRALQLLKNLLDNATQNQMKSDYQSKPALPNNTNSAKDQQGCFVSSPSMSMGFSTPTSPGFDENIDDVDHGIFSKQVSIAIQQLDSHLLSLHTQNTLFSRSPYQNQSTHINTIDEFLTQPSTSCYVHGLRIPSANCTTTSEYNVHRQISTTRDSGLSITNYGHQILTRPTLLGHESRRRRNQQLVSEPDSESESYSTNDDNDPEMTIPSEVSESDEDGFDDYDNSNEDIDEIQSSNHSRASTNSSSYYSIARSETNPRRRVHGGYESDKATRISTLKRIKNKLGLIFHHHHHHHHHHQYQQQHDHNSNPHDTSWKLLQRMFHHRNNNSKKKKSNSINAMGRTRRRRSIVKSSTNNRVGGGGGRGDVGHFRALVEALVKHVRGGGGGKKPAGLGGGKKQNKNGWRLGRVKMGGNNRRGRVKVGFNKLNQLPKLKM